MKLTTKESHFLLGFMLVETGKIKAEISPREAESVFGVNEEMESFLNGVDDALHGDFFRKKLIKDAFSGY